MSITGTNASANQDGFICMLRRGDGVFGIKYNFYLYKLGKTARSASEHALFYNHLIHS